MKIDDNMPSNRLMKVFLKITVAVEPVDTLNLSPLLKEKLRDGSAIQGFERSLQSCTLHCN